MITIELSDAEARYVKELVSKEAKRLEPKITAECSERDRHNYHCASGVYAALEQDEPSEKENRAVEGFDRFEGMELVTVRKGNKWHNEWQKRGEV